jgi:carbohydrate binding protein with CBM5/12 domain
MSQGVSNWYYYANFAVAFGEGPATITRLWGDSKLIYSSIPGDQSDFPVGDYPPWSATTTYNPNNLVSYNGQVFQCVTANTGVAPSSVLPQSGSIYWTVASSYPPWQSGVAYSQGQTVSYLGQIYVAKANNPGGPPGSGNWETITSYYGTPTIYPGTETQGVDPLIQSSEGVLYTPAYRGLCYIVWENFPLLNFGNRIPNLRAEINFTKVNNVL